MIDSGEWIGTGPEFHGWQKRRLITSVFIHAQTRHAQMRDAIPKTKHATIEARPHWLLKF
jgi:hypothetical protein